MGRVKNDKKYFWNSTNRKMTLITPLQFQLNFLIFKNKRADNWKEKFCCSQNIYVHWILKHLFWKCRKNNIKYLRQSGIHPDIRNWRMLPPGNGNDVDSVLCKKLKYSTFLWIKEVEWRTIESLGKIFSFLKKRTPFSYKYSAFHGKIISPLQCLY